MIFDRVPEFSKELKSYSKKWRTLEADLAIAEASLEQLYCSQEIPDRALMLQTFFDGKRATILTQSAQSEVVKMRLDCSSPGTQGKLRLIFIYIKTATEIRFIELYSKTDKPREDPRRIEKYLAQTHNRES